MPRQKIFVTACTGKANFIGFSINNSESIGRTSERSTEKSFINELSTSLWDGVDGVLTKPRNPFKFWSAHPLVHAATFASRAFYMGPLNPETQNVQRESAGAALALCPGVWRRFRQSASFAGRGSWRC